MKPVIRSNTPARHQRGVTLLGLLFWAVIVGAIAMVLMKVFPAVNEYYAIQKTVNAVAKGGASSVAEVRSAFDQRKSIEYGIESITGRDLEVAKDNDKIVISFAYEREIELFDPVFLLIKFKGHSR